MEEVDLTAMQRKALTLWRLANTYRRVTKRISDLEIQEFNRVAELLDEAAMTIADYEKIGGPPNFLDDDRVTNEDVKVLLGS